jgi:hypothetical protein
MASNKAVTFNDTAYEPLNGDIPKFSSSTGLWVPSGLAQNVGSVYTATVLGPAGDIDLPNIATSAKTIYSFTGHIVCVVNKPGTGAWPAGNFCTWDISYAGSNYGPLGVLVDATPTATVYPGVWSDVLAPPSIVPNFNPFSTANGFPGNRFGSTVAFIKSKPGSIQFSVRIPVIANTAGAEYRVGIVLMMTTSSYQG